MADAFLADVRRDLERAAAAGCDLPPRLRSVHVKPGHATPEYRNLAIPLEAAPGGSSPAALSGLIARYAALHPACCIFLAMDVVMASEDGVERPMLVTEARDDGGTRLFWMQPFAVRRGRIQWEAPLEGGWQHPGDQEMILDHAFAPPATADAPPVVPQPSA